MYIELIKYSVKHYNTPIYKAPRIHTQHQSDHSASNAVKNIGVPSDYFLQGKPAIITHWHWHRYQQELSQVT